MSPLEKLSSEDAGFLFCLILAGLGMALFCFSMKPPAEAPEPVTPEFSGGVITVPNPLELAPEDQFQAIESSDTIVFEQIPLSSFIEELPFLEGRKYVVCSSCIFRFEGPEKMTLVVLFPKKLRISAAVTVENLGHYWEVQGSATKDFAGLLECRDGKWTFYCYGGEYRGRVKSGSEKGGLLVLLMEGEGDRSIIFNPKTGEFSDM